MILLALGFVRCDSLGNTFLLFDLTEQENRMVQSILRDPTLPTAASELCQKHKTDGVLIVHRADNHILTTIVNKDGSPGGLCLNGARCIAWHLWRTYRMPPRITLRMGNTLIDCQKKGSRVSVGVPKGKYHGRHKILAASETFTGSIVDVGNPHFIVFEGIHPDWLVMHGESIATHPGFTEGTNVEFVQKVSDSQYFMQIYERGVGYSHACSSACVALTTLLYRTNQLTEGTIINIKMPGGEVFAQIDSFGLIQIEAEKPGFFV